MAHLVLVSTMVPAELRVFAACPHCGVSEKPSQTIHVPANVDTQPQQERVSFSCERCGDEDAVLLLERRPLLH